MGFRITAEVGRLGLDMVWAEIAVAALAGSAFYGVVALIEKAGDVLAPVATEAELTRPGKRATTWRLTMKKLLTGALLGGIGRRRRRRPMM